MDKEALRGYIGMIGLALDKIYELVEQDEQAKICQHPLSARMDMSTMGHTMWRCKSCGYTFEQSLEAEDVQVRTD